MINLNQHQSELQVYVAVYTHSFAISVQKTNYAVRMYQKTGFGIGDENEEEYIMRCRL